MNHLQALWSPRISCQAKQCIQRRQTAYLHVPYVSPPSRKPSYCRATSQPERCATGLSRPHLIRIAFLTSRIAHPSPDQVSDTTVVYVRTCRLQRRQRKLALFLPFVFPPCSVKVRYSTLEFPRLRPPATEPRVKHAHADHNVKRYCHMVLLSDSLSHLV